jgi:DNA-binding transcriptional regulator YhcF (GntR family)
VKRVHELTDQERSIYLQISDLIQTDILRGILCEQERVPSTNELARLYTINPATAAKGVNLLVDAGILYKKRGIGMFVAPGAREQILRTRREIFLEKQVRQMVGQAESLGISKAELIEKISRL